jgi:hypothetical protein
MTCEPAASKGSPLTGEAGAELADTHVLVSGTLYLRCAGCGTRPVPHNWSFIQLCDLCLIEALREASRG